MSARGEARIISRFSPELSGIVVSLSGHAGGSASRCGCRGRGRENLFCSAPDEKPRCFDSKHEHRYISRTWILCSKVAGMFQNRRSDLGCDLLPSTGCWSAKAVTEATVVLPKLNINVWKQLHLKSLTSPIPSVSLVLSLSRSLSLTVFPPFPLFPDYRWFSIAPSVSLSLSLCLQLAFPLPPHLLVFLSPSSVWGCSGLLESREHPWSAHRRESRRVSLAPENLGEACRESRDRGLRRSIRNGLSGKRQDGALIGYSSRVGI